jgi:hypothetical protein
MSALLAFAEKIEQTPIGVAIAESRYAFPIIEGLHLIGLAISVGLIFITDLRLIGVLFRQVPVTNILRDLRPFVLAGFAAVFVSGGLLFWAEAATVMASPAFPFKMLFIAFAGINALYFELVIARRADLQSNNGALPRAARLAGAASLMLWSLVVIFGRLIPYLPRWS